MWIIIWQNGHAEKDEQNELLKIQIEEYANFIRSFVDQNAIISKNFFIVVPLRPDCRSGPAKGFLGLFGKKTSDNEKNVMEKENLEQLRHRTEQVIEGLSQTGIRAAYFGKRRSNGTFL